MKSFPGINVNQKFYLNVNIKYTLHVISGKSGLL